MSSILPTTRAARPSRAGSLPVAAPAVKQRGPLPGAFCAETPLRPLLAPLAAGRPLVAAPGSSRAIIARRPRFVARSTPANGGDAWTAAADKVAVAVAHPAPPPPPHSATAVAAPAAAAAAAAASAASAAAPNVTNGNNGSSGKAATSAVAAPPPLSKAATAAAATATASAAAAAAPVAAGGIRGPAHALDIFYRFSRPHTMIGTLLSVISVSLMALAPASTGALLGWPLPDAGARAVAVALAAALCANVSIVGLNQLYDVEIDRINKPYLPLASGELTLKQGWWIVGGTAVASLALAAWAASPPLLATVAGSLALGLVYSTELPFMRWKRSPMLAAACILTVRAIAVQLGFFLHVKHALAAAGAATAATAAAASSGGAPLAFAVSFMALFSIVIALFKDLPDVAGDKAAGIATFSVRFGTARVFRCCVGVLAAAYAGGTLYGLDMARRALAQLALGSAGAADAGLAAAALAALPGALVALGHAALGALLVARSKETDASSPPSLAAHYMWVWKLFYTEYLLLPLLR